MEDARSEEKEAGKARLEREALSRGSFNEEPATGRSIDCPYRKSRLFKGLVQVLRESLLRD